MKYSFTLGVLLVLTTATAQEDTLYNRLSVDAQLGVNNPISPMAPGYDAATFNFFHAGIGVRYALTTRFGLRLGGGYDHFQNRPGALDFNSDYYRVSLEGVVNIGNILNFDNWTRRLGLLMHAGLGYSALNGQQFGTNNMMHGIIGITPQIRLTERWNLYLDGSVLAHVYQQYTYDMTERYSNPGIDGYLYNLSLGVQYNIGRHARHADWASVNSTRENIELLKERMNRLEQNQLDNDGDGVPNYLDEEPGTPTGSTVDTKGRTVVQEAKDSDSDNIPDDVDDCPFEKGTPAMRGCPERTGNTIGGNGSSSASTIALIENSEVKFETDRADLSPSFKEMLDGIAMTMKDNPSYNLNVTGHADDRASEEYNMNLSQERANAVKAYLVSKGIAASRVTTTAVGETQPKNPLHTVEARAENRRVQFDVK